MTVLPACGLLTFQTAPVNPARVRKCQLEPFGVQLGHAHVWLGVEPVLKCILERHIDHHPQHGLEFVAPRPRRIFLAIKSYWTLEVRHRHQFHRL